MLLRRCGKLQRLFFGGIDMVKKSVLAINFNEERLKQLKRLSLLVKAQVKAVTELDKEEQLGKVVGFTEQEIEAITEQIAANNENQTTDNMDNEDIIIEEPVTKEAIVLCGFENKDVHTLLDAIRGSSLKSVPLKAMLTSYNITWKISDMLIELAKEYEYFRQRK